MIWLREHIHIRENEIVEEFCCSGGPGGQNVNKVSTTARLRFHIASSSLSPEIKNLLFQRLAHRINSAGELLVESRTHRTQLMNRKEAFDKLENILRAALTPVKKRHDTKPTFASKKRRLQEKKHNSATKNMRRDIEESND